jgi:FAD synthetase
MTFKKKGNRIQGCDHPRVNSGVDRNNVILKLARGTVMVFGTFDGLHPGHENFFQQARALGQRVIAVVARDLSVRKIKGRFPQENEQKRARKLRARHWAKKVCLGSVGDKLKIIEHFKPSILALGFDQKTFSMRDLKQELRSRGMPARIIRLKAYRAREFKSSLLKKL